MSDTKPAPMPPDQALAMAIFHFNEHAKLHEEKGRPLGADLYRRIAEGLEKLKDAAEEMP